jgi:hypothetical protein
MQKMPNLVALAAPSKKSDSGPMSTGRRAEPRVGMARNAKFAVSVERRYCAHLVTMEDIHVKE